MNIKDPRVHELAKELAQVRGTTVTAAGREVLEETLGREKRTPEKLAELFSQLQSMVVGSEDQWLSDDNLYKGLPR
ncbi:type II toxin-antitoxin system VapB family antitoxin [Actinomycetaceae bacterium MB13-C1-2]|nr:type II toxin-antitoxin system VapB family antitoxin [Actinomycetaceae bacterium MB13-C1-2]